MQTISVKTPIEIAKNKLEKHQELGSKSNLSIAEAAHLMDIITFGVNEIESKQPVFFSFSLN